MAEDDQDHQDHQDYPPLTFTRDGAALLVNGVVSPGAIDAFKAAMAAHPDVKALELQCVPGSMDDDTNLALGRLVRAAGLTTAVAAGGLVSSGGTDLFLAGRRRWLSADACVGVHSWGDGETTSGADTARDDLAHQPYLDYYRAMGIDVAFYWFTLDVSGPEDVHWMTPAEIIRFGMITEPFTTTAQDGGTIRARCLARDDERRF